MNWGGACDNIWAEVQPSNPRQFRPLSGVTALAPTDIRDDIAVYMGRSRLKGREGHFKERERGRKEQRKGSERRREGTCTHRIEIMKDRYAGLCIRIKA